MRKVNGDSIRRLPSDRGDSIKSNLDNNIRNPYFNFETNDNTHQLINNIAQQFIQTNGITGFFIPKEFSSVDRLFGEEMGVKYDKAWQFAFYLESYTDFDGMGLSFEYSGLTASDQMKIMINPQLFQHQCEGRMPEMGDWVYLKNDNSVFEVKHVDPYNRFYQHGMVANIFVHLTKVNYNQEEVAPVIQNIDFNLFDYEDDDLLPLHNLNGRLDKDINELVVNDYIMERSEDIILDDKPRTGEGYHPPKEDKNRKKIKSVDEMNSILNGRKLR